MSALVLSLFPGIGLPGYSIAEMCELQGLPANLLDKAPFTIHGKKYVIGNGVPLPMGRAIAKAVKEATHERD